MDIKVQNQIDLIRDSVLQIVPAEAIYLFGSYAYGTPVDDSDLDIYVVVPDDTVDLTERYADIRGLICEKKTVSLDLLITRSSVFNRRKNAPTLERVIAEKGTVLYGA
jgi:predicted nucleotidyltransferase